MASMLAHCPSNSKCVLDAILGERDKSGMGANQQQYPINLIAQYKYTLQQAISKHSTLSFLCLLSIGKSTYAWQISLQTVVSFNVQGGRGVLKQGIWGVKPHLFQELSVIFSFVNERWLIMHDLLVDTVLCPT